MNSVGIDLHRKRSHVAALDEHGGELFSRRIANDPDTFVALLAGLDGESKIALEATYGWEWLADLLEDHGYELHLAHPLRTKAIASARVKTDAVDARTLAHLLRAPTCCPRRTWRPGSCASCATCCASGSCSPRCARRSRTASTP
jgi:transposase